MAKRRCAHDSPGKRGRGADFGPAAALVVSDTAAAKNDALDRVRSTQQKVAKNVASTLQDAQAKRAAAEAARSQADRVEELAAAEKQKRQEERAAAKS